MNHNALHRTALSIAMGICLVALAPAAVAQDGAVAGRSVAGAQITVRNPETGFSRMVVADADGNYRFPFLPVGTYTLEASKDGTPVAEPVQVTVNLGNATVVNPGAAATTLGTVEVVGSRVINAVDVTSTESATNITREQLERLPVDQTISSVATLAPGVQKGNASFGGISFGGSSVAENSFYINGLNVTDFYNRVGFSSAPFAFYEEFQVKTGGYSVEFGRSTGGVINAVTRSGTNEFRFGTEVTLEPRDWQAESEDRFNADGTRYITASRDNYSRTKANFYASGPIVRDKLFFFAMYELRDYRPQNTNNAGTTLTKRESDDGFWGGKIDWQINDNHLLEFMAFSDQNTSESITYAYDFESDAISDESEPVFFESGGKNWNTTYTGYLTDMLSMKLMYGETERNNSQFSPSDLECNRVVQEEVEGVFPAPALPLGCTTSSRVEERLDERTAIRADFEWQIGDHLLRFGADREENVSNYDRFYPGPDQIYYNIYYLDTPGAVIPDAGGARLPPGENIYVRARQYGVNGTFETINSAFYLEDNWNITDNLLLNLGLRWEAFDNKDSDGNSYIKIDDMWAPRVGFSWDMRGDGTTKLFGNAGRYYLPVANVINIKQAGGFLDARTYYAFEGYREETRNGFTYLMPILGEQLGFDDSQGDGTVGDLRTEVDADMDPVYQDEFILGFEQALSQTWSWGVQATYRDLTNAIDDMEVDATACGRDGPGFVMANPGEELTIYGDTDCDGVNDGYITIDTSVAGSWKEDDNYRYVADRNGDGVSNDPGWVYINSTPTGQAGWVDPERTYKAVEFQLDRAWDGQWAFNASYVWSKSEGNAEGPVNSDTEFSDTGRTENFDDPWVNFRGYGYLANDRRHQIKLRGAYALSDYWRVGASLDAQSGGPITGFGVGNPFDWDTYNSYYICVDNCSPEQTYPGAEFGDTWSTSERIYDFSPRGAYGTLPWTYVFNVSLTYQRPLAFGDLAVKLSVYNLFDQQREIDVNQDLQESVDGGLNANFLRPVRFQSPRYAQIVVSFDF